MCASTVDIQSAAAEIRRVKTRRQKKKPPGKNIMACPITQGGHNEYESRADPSEAAVYNMWLG